MKQKIFTGAAVAIVTPFKGENFDEVDYDALGDLIEFQIDNGTDAIVICGTTGEASTMPDSEHLSVIEYAVRKTAGRIPVIAGTGKQRYEACHFAEPAGRIARCRRASFCYTVL